MGRTGLQKQNARQRARGQARAADFRLDASTCFCAITRKNLRISILRDVRREARRLADAGRTMRAIVDLLPPTALKKSDFNYDLPAELIAQAPWPSAPPAACCWCRKPRRVHRPAGA